MGYFDQTRPALFIAIHLDYSPNRKINTKNLIELAPHAPRAPSCPRSQQYFKKIGPPASASGPSSASGDVQNAPVPNYTRQLCSVDLNLGTVPKLRHERYESSLRPSSSMASMSASAAAASSPLAKMYSLILGSVPEGRTMALFPRSSSNSMTSALGRPFTHVA